MNRKKLMMLLVFGFMTFFLNVSHVFAAGSCSASGVDQSIWKFDHTESVLLGENKDFELSGVVKRVCCESQNGKYYCDYYTATIDETNTSDGSKELTDIPCDLSDGNWTFQKSYTAPSNESTTTQNRKICCKGNGLKNGGETFRCNSYKGEKTEEIEQKPTTSLPVQKGNKISGSCGVFSDLIPYIQEIYGYLKIIMPIALIVFGAVDFTGPVLSSDKDALKKAGVKFTKRCIVVIAMFLVPALLKFILQAYSDATGKDASLCGLIGMVIQNWR